MKPPLELQPLAPANPSSEKPAFANAKSLFRAIGDVLKRGGTISEFLANLTAPLPGLSETLLRRAALVRAIDEPLYLEVLTAGVTDAPAFADFRQRSELESSTPDSCSLRPAERKERIPYWSEHSDECVAFAKKLEAFYKRTGAGFDQFLASLLAEPREAAQRFLTLYHELDEVFALSGCQALLAALIDRHPVLSEELRKAVNDREQYLRSRTLFGDDYNRTIVHVKREAAATSFENLLKDPHQWIMQLHGGGGVGKTMFLRWLIAHRCIPEQRDGERIPVARIDLDSLDRKGLGEYPGLVFFPLMKQLTQQLPNNPFQSYLWTLRDCAAALMRPTGREDAGSRRKLRKEIEASSKSISNLPEAFISAVKDRQVLVVLDTIEDMLLHQTAQLESILRLLAKVKKDCPRFYLVISGRFDFVAAAGDKEFKKGRLPKFAQDHKGEILVVNICNFDELETKAYCELRKIPEEMRDAIWRKTKGHPLEVTLLCDLVIADPKLTASKIQNLRPRYARLIERIIDRIPQEQHALRWLLRYAVVPRQLDLDYVRNVVNQHVRSEALGKSRHDDTGRYPDEHIQRRYGRQERWTKLDKVELDKAWNQLRSYAAQTSWVTEEEGVIRLQPELVEPMRELLRINPIFRELQDSSRKYFERLAKSQPESWGRWTAEAVYHRLQIEDRGAAHYWNRKLSEARGRGFEELEEIAEVVFGPEFLDDEMRLRVKIPRSRMAVASYDLAYASLIHLLRIPTRHETFQETVDELSRRWDKLKRYTKGSARHAVSTSKRNLIYSGYLFFVKNKPQAALKPALLARRGLNEPAALLAAELLIASRIFWLQLKPSRPHFMAARRLAQRSRSRDLPLPLIDNLLARSFLEADDLLNAGKFFALSLYNVEDAGGAVDSSVAFRRAAETYYEASDWKAAEALQSQFREFTQRGPGVQYQWLHAEARLRLTLGDYEAASVSCLRAGAAASNPKERGAHLELRGELEAACCRIEASKSSFESAATPYSEAGSRYGIPNCRLKTARMYLDAAGDAIHAAEWLLAVGEVDPPKLKLDAARIEVRVLAQNSPEAASKFWRRKLDEFQRGEFSPRAQARFLVLGLALGLGDERDLKQLWPLLQKIQPDSAVYGIFGDFEYFTGAPWASSYFDRLKRFSPNPQPTSAGGILQALAYANAMHFFGHSDSAATWILRCLRAANRFPGLESRLHAALFRIAPERYPLAKIPKNKSKWETDPADPFRLRYLQEAERAFARNRESDAGAWLELVRVKEWPTSLARSKWGIRANLLDAQLTGIRTKQGRHGLLTASDIAREIGYALPDWASLEVTAIQTKALSDEDIAPPCFTVSVRSGKKTHEEILLSWQTPGGGKRELTQMPFLDPMMERLPRTFALSHVESLLSDSQGLPVRLVVENRDFERFPWESQFPDAWLIYRDPQSQLRLNHTIRSIQRSLVKQGHSTLRIDGILGPETSAALRRSGLTDSRSIREACLGDRSAPGKVLVVQADMEASRFLKRGHGAEGIRVTRIYERLGIQATEHVYRNLDELMYVFQRSGASLVHLVTNFWQTKEGDYVPDFSYSADTILTPRALAASLQTTTLSAPAPIVIVESLRPPSDYELGVQGVARNRFCADLFVAGEFKAVLGTGFWKGSTQVALETFVQVFAQRSVGELGRTASWYFDWPAVLYTNDPGLPLWET